MVVGQALRSSQQMREVMAALFGVFLGPENHHIILHMGEQTSAHGEAVRARKITSTALLRSGRSAAR
eukprot:4661018-Pyramimonas_sp.AAC.1